MAQPRYHCDNYLQQYSNHCQQVLEANNFASQAIVPEPKSQLSAVQPTALTGGGLDEEGGWTFSPADGSEQSLIVDGNFEQAGALYREIQRVEPLVGDDPVFSTMFAYLVDQTRRLQSTWTTTGDVQLQTLESQNFVRLRQTEDTSLGQLVVPDNPLGSLSFYILARHADDDDRLEVTYGDQVVATIDLSDVTEVEHRRVSLADIDATPGELVFRIKGPETDTAVVFLDRIELTEDLLPWQNDNPYDVDNDGDVDVLDAIRLISFLRDPQNGISNSPTTPEAVPEIFPDVNGDNRADVLDALALISELRNPSKSVMQGEGEAPALVTGQKLQQRHEVVPLHFNNIVSFSEAPAHLSIAAESPTVENQETTLPQRTSQTVPPLDFKSSNSAHDDWELEEILSDLAPSVAERWQANGTQDDLNGRVAEDLLFAIAPGFSSI